MATLTIGSSEATGAGLLGRLQNAIDLLRTLHRDLEELVGPDVREGTEAERPVGCTMDRAEVSIEEIVRLIREAGEQVYRIKSKFSGE